MIEDIFGFSKKRRKKDIFDIGLFPSYEEKRKRIRITKADKRKLWEKQKGKCARCKKKLNPHAYHIDHKVPKALGGSYSLRNLQLLCPECHMLKTQEDRKKISKKKKKKQISGVEDIFGFKSTKRRKDPFSLW